MEGFFIGGLLKEIIFSFEGLPDEEVDIDSVYKVLERIRAGYDVFGVTLQKWRESANLETSHMIEAKKRLEKYESSNNEADLIDLIYYLLREMFERSSLTV